MVCAHDFKCFVYVCVWVLTCVYVCTTNACCSFRGHWKVSDPLELDFQAVVSCLIRVLGTKCWPCVFSPPLPLFWFSHGCIVRPCLKSNYNRLLPQLAIQRIRVKNFRAHSEPGPSEGEATPLRNVQSLTDRSSQFLPGRQWPMRRMAKSKGCWLDVSKACVGSPFRLVALVISWGEDEYSHLPASRCSPANWKCFRVLATGMTCRDSCKLMTHPPPLLLFLFPLPAVLGTEPGPGASHVLHHWLHL